MKLNLNFVDTCLVRFIKYNNNNLGPVDEKIEITMVFIYDKL